VGLYAEPMSIHRGATAHGCLRTGLCGLAVLLAGCVSWRGEAAGETIVEVRSGRSIPRAELLAAMRASDHVLLGERHDNPAHHARRGDLLAELRPPAAVVAEQLPRGSTVRLGSDLAASLNAAGFEPRAWGWPLHEPLFAGIARAGLPLAGGNVPRALARQVAREGEAALPAELATLLRSAPLDSAAQAALDADLVQGHCGQLPAERLPGMRWSQRARDGSMLIALREQGGTPSVLVAGNGHVRLDHGVGQLIAATRPAARVLSVGFVEAGEVGDPAGAPYTHLWITPRIERPDPCAGFTMPPQPRR
jgi:uncharacterized iron-regulated protein